MIEAKANTFLFIAFDCDSEMYQKYFNPQIEPGDNREFFHKLFLGNPIVTQSRFVLLKKSII